MPEPPRRERFAAEILILLLILLAVAAGQHLHLFETLEVKTIDLRYARARTAAPYEGIVVVTIDAEDLAELGEWPWPRRFHGELVRRLKDAGARLVAFDCFFDTPSSDAREDELFIAACREAGNVVAARPFQEEGQPPRNEEGIFVIGGDGPAVVDGIASIDILPELKSTLVAHGLVDLNYAQLNSDGIIRCLDLVRFHDGVRYPAMAVEMARVALGLPPEALVVRSDEILLGDRRAPLFRHLARQGDRFVERAPFFVRYTGPWNEAFHSVPFTHVLKGVEPAATFRDRIVIVGASSAALFDTKITPFGETPGVYINALIARGLIEGDFVRRVGRGTSALLLSGVALLLFLYLTRVRPSWIDPLALAGALLAIWHSAVRLFAANLVLVEVVAPAVLIVAAVVIIRFWQMFVRLHLSNRELVRTNRALDDRVHELETLHDLSQSLQTVADAKKTYRVILQKALAVTGTRVGCLLLYDEKTESVRVEESELPPDFAAPEFEAQLHSVGLRHIENRRILHLSRGGSAFAALDLSDERIAGLLVAPFASQRGDLLGMIVLAHMAGEDPFTQEDERIIYLIASQAASVIENTKLYLMAVIDGLTGLYVRRYFDARLSHEVNRHRRYGGSFSLVMIDIDHFKNFNDTWGHQIGDAVLRETAKVVALGLREVDLAARFGGEEMCTLLPETNLEGATLVAERIRRGVETHAVPGPKGPLQVTVSVGVAEYETDMPPDELMRRADAALYRSKEGGRNRVTAWTPAVDDKAGPAAG